MIGSPRRNTDTDEAESSGWPTQAHCRLEWDFQLGAVLRRARPLFSRVTSGAFAKAERQFSATSAIWGEPKDVSRRAENPKSDT